MPGCLVVDILYIRDAVDGKDKEDFYHLNKETARRTKFEHDIELLASLGLIRKVSIFYLTKFKIYKNVTVKNAFNILQF